MFYPISDEELYARITKNYTRLEEPYYQLEQVFAPATYDWPADKEGRALLAFVSHYKISGKKIPCMEQMMEALPAHLNEQGFLGPCGDGVIREQQLSGHSWLLRGLCEYAEQFDDDAARAIVQSIVEGLFLPTAGLYGGYPVERSEKPEGDVSGSEIDRIGVWKLSSDIGCAFMSVDGLSHAYELLRDERILALLDEMVAVYLSIDKFRLKVQTHCTLTAARGMLRLYSLTKAGKYLDGARAIYELYVNGGGMTDTYQNLNWWGRPDTWTEPCAIVDSLMVALELYKITGKASYRTLAARVYHNGFSTAQRDNGGAGTDTIVTAESPWNDLQAKMYEAAFCCTMRLAEGLWYIQENRELLYAEITGEVQRGADGIYRDGDRIYAEVEGGAEAYAEHFVERDGHRLCPIVQYYRVPREVLMQSRQTVRFS